MPNSLFLIAIDVCDRLAFSRTDLINSNIY